MATKIQIKKGLDIKLVGEPTDSIQDTKASIVYAVQPSDFYPFIPKLLVKQGEEIKAGTPLFCSKENEEIRICSPVSGIVEEIVRGEQRRILHILLKPSSTQVYLSHLPLEVGNSTAEQIKDYFSKTGLFPFIWQRPYGILANPNDIPKEIVISGINSAPLAPDLKITLQGKEKEIQAAVSALAKLTTGKVHITTVASNTILTSLKDAQIHIGEGPHPIGNLSVQIEKINPINKGEKIWTVRAEDLVIIGTMILSGKFDMERILAVAGSQIEHPRYQRTLAGAKISDILAHNLKGENNRIIDGNVLTGKTTSLEGFLSYFSNEITAIKEGDDYQLFGWQMPQPKKLSKTRALMFSFLQPNKKYDLDTNTNGEHRAFVLTGALDQVFPQDIYPLELIKACLAKDIDRMEKLGIYEVVPEDFALTEFVDVSKNNHQQIIKDAIDLMIKEVN